MKTQQEAYMEGFCKTAEAYGVDPRQLIKSAQKYKTDGAALIEEGDSLLSDQKLPSIPNPRLSNLDASLLGEMVDPYCNMILGSRRNRITAGDVVKARNSILNPSRVDQTRVSWLSPTARDLYTAATNSIDVATAPWTNMPPHQVVTAPMATASFLHGINNYSSHPAVQKYPKDQPKAQPKP